MLVACTPLPFDVRAELAGVEVVTAAGAALRGAAMAADGVVCLLSDPIDRALLAAAPRLRVVANVAVGVDNIDVAAATELGVCVANTPDVLTEATADLTWALILAAARRLGEGERLVRAGRFAGWALDLLLGVDG
ncbi:MAG: D-glycerate dehydrogenase, partial [Kofleriaceae bacterium]|nr:D-glycerate dehydrogenase [Kofleriaceae bacterium]